MSNSFYKLEIQMNRCYYEMVKPINSSHQFVDSLLSDKKLKKIYMNDQSMYGTASFGVVVGRDKDLTPKIIPIVVIQTEKGLVDPISGVVFDDKRINSVLLEPGSFGTNYFHSISPAELENNIKKMNEKELEIYRLTVQRFVLFIEERIKNYGNIDRLVSVMSKEENSDTSLKFIDDFQRSHGIYISK